MTKRLLLFCLFLSGCATEPWSAEKSARLGNAQRSLMDAQQGLNSVNKQPASQGQTCQTVDVGGGIYQTQCR